MTVLDRTKKGGKEGFPHLKVPSHLQNGEWQSGSVSPWETEGKENLLMKPRTTTGRRLANSDD